MSKREDIVAELKLRLYTAIGKMPERGIIGGPVTRYPSLWLFEDTEIRRLHKPGQYIKTLPIYFEWFEKVSNPDAIYSKGNQMINDTAAAIELDDNFGNENDRFLCTSYLIEEVALIQWGDNVIDMVAKIMFTYVENFLGYNKIREL